MAYVTGSLFSAPKGSILVQACNAKGSWGAGIALEFKARFPAAFQRYKAHCTERGDDLAGSCLLIPEQDYSIACLFTSRAYGKRKDKPAQILAATKLALEDLKRQNATGLQLHACRFNSGKFGVPWEATEAVIEEVGLTMTVYTPE